MEYTSRLHKADLPEIEPEAELPELETNFAERADVYSEPAEARSKLGGEQTFSQRQFRHPEYIQGAEASEERALEGIRELDPDRWRKLNETERLAALQQAENALATAQGRPDMPVRVEQLPSNHRGYFDGDRITLNADLVRNPDVRQSVETLAHEGRHAYQRHAVDNTGTHPDAQAVEQWQNNFDNYKTVQQHGFRAYYNQPVEQDARAYADRIVRARYGGI